ncbi:MAG: HEAT repeat domain-containing protein [Flaviramulus sp.]|nr:HEAT repeat domain-containing protein [Flaviramulus sp.]
MFYKIIFLIFKLKFIQPSERAINYLMHNEEVEKLEYTLRFGNYKNRKLSAEALGVIGKPSSIPVLINVMNDKVQNVSMAVLNALETLEDNDELVKTIVNKRFNWLKLVTDSKVKYEVNKNKKYKIYRWERASKKSFDRAKEQLKKPMR